MRPNLFVNTPDILTEYLQFGGPAAFTVRDDRRDRRADVGRLRGLRAVRVGRAPGRRGGHRQREVRVQALRLRRRREGRHVAALYLGILNRIRAEHPALGQLRNIRFHYSDDDSVLVYSKHLEGRFIDGRATTTTTRSSSSRTSTRTRCARRPSTSTSPRSTSNLDTTFGVEDLVTGERWDWGEHNYVRLDAFTQPVHILRGFEESHDRHLARPCSRRGRRPPPRRRGGPPPRPARGARPARIRRARAGRRAR